MMYNRTKKNKDMNNNIIKSLRRTLLCTVAAAAVTIGFTACADETFTTQNANAPANDNGYKLIVPSNIGGGDTRAIAYDETQGKFVATFETTDNIFVYDVTKNADGMKKLDRKPDQEYDEWEATYLHPNANAKDVTLEGELTFYSRGQDNEYYVVTPEKGDELVLYYNWARRDISYSSLYFNEYNMNAYPDFATAKVKIESIKDGVIKTSPATFTHTQSIYQIKFTGLPSDIKIKKVTIDSEQKKLVSNYNPATESNGFDNVSYFYGEEGTDQSELTFMLRFADNPNNQGSNGDVIGFRAIASDGYYYYGTRAVKAKLENGQYYNGEVAMLEDGKVMTWTNDDTGELVKIEPWWNSIISTEAAYTIADKGYDTPFYWIGGENTLTFKNLSLHNENWGDIQLSYDPYVGDNTKTHHLLLDGVNTIYKRGLNVNEGSLDIAAASEGAQLNIENGNMVGFNATMTIKSGEITINGTLELYDNSTIMVEGGVLTMDWFSSYDQESCIIIAKDGKVRARNFFDKERIKATEGYALMVAEDGEYKVYTVVEDDGLTKSISVTPTAILGYSDLLGEEGTMLNVIVNPETAADKSVTWKSSNPDIVYVSKYGDIDSRGVGTATVTAMTNDGSNLSADCIVTVKPMGGIIYDYNLREISKTPKSQPFTNPLTREGKITSVTYTSSDESIAKVNSSTGEVTIAAGATIGQTFTITATATVKEDGDYIYPERTRTASYTVKLMSATSEAEREDYPSGGSW